MADLESESKRPFLKNIFLSPDEPRLRAGWRLLIQTILLIALSFCAGIPIGLLFLIPGLDLPDGLFLALNQVIEIIAVTGSIYLAMRFLDKRPFSSLGLKLDKWTALDLFAGLVELQT